MNATITGNESIKLPGSQSPTAEEKNANVPKCLYCGSAELKELYPRVRDRLNYVPGERSWWQCQKCKSAVLVPQPRPEDLPGFYPPVYSFAPELGNKGRLAGLLSKLEHQFFFGPQFRAQVRQIERIVGGAKKGPRLLDIGAGRGLRLLELRKLGFEVHALDLQEEVVDYLRDVLGIPAVRADVSEADKYFQAESFDVVTAYFLLEHIRDVFGFLKDCFRLLRPGGWVAVAIPFFDSVQASIFGRRWINVTEAPRHLSLPTQAGAFQVFHQAGFTNVSLVPDAISSCAAAFAGSVITNGTVTHVYGQSGFLRFLPRFLGAALILASMPFCYWESHIAGRPPSGIVFARKPLSNNGAT